MTESRPAVVGKVTFKADGSVVAVDEDGWWWYTNYDPRDLMWGNESTCEAAAEALIKRGYGPAAGPKATLFDSRGA